MKNYIEEAKVTDVQNYGAVQERCVDHKTLKILHGAIGLSTESGEILDCIKKHLFYGKPLDLVNLKEELGDIFWYCALLAGELGITFDEVQDVNIQKLRARFPNKFNEYDATHRDIEKERYILEGRN